MGDLGATRPRPAAPKPDTDGPLPTNILTAIPIDEAFEGDARLRDVAWTPDSTRLLYDIELGDLWSQWRDKSYVTVVADIASKQIVNLTMPQDLEGRLRFYGFSPDGRAIIHSGRSLYGPAEGHVLVHDRPFHYDI